MTESVLLIVTSRPAEVVQAAQARFRGSPVAVLDLSQHQSGTTLPQSWRPVQVSEYMDTAALRSEFLTFLDDWPRRPLFGGRSFDERFRRPGNYSVWWTGVGIDRHPDRGVFPALRTIWICDRVIRALAPRRVAIYTRRAPVASALAARCQHSNTEYEFLPGSARPVDATPASPARWLVLALAKLAVIPCRAVIRAVSARLLCRVEPVPAQERQAPSIVLVSELSRDLRQKGDRVIVWFWHEVREALRCLDSSLPHRHRVGYRKRSWFFHKGWRILRRLEGALPPDERHPALGAWSRALWPQLRDIFTYYRLERMQAVRDSFVFANSDISALYVPKVRRAIERSAHWAQAVGSAARSLAEAGHVKAMLVVKELYPSEMVTIAAARELGIPTIGVQHGTIFPMHLIYTVPRGYVEGAPIPDYFAVYGEYAKDTVSAYGAYPAARVWVTGGARFDHLVSGAGDPLAARRRLDLPVDRPIVLMTTQFYPWFPEAARALYAATKHRTDCLVCVKTHQISDRPLEFYRTLARDVQATNVRFFNDRFYDLLLACDVLVSASSTTVFEAILLGRGTICVNFSDEPDRYPYVADGGSLGARTEEELSRALDRLLSKDLSESHEMRRQFLRRHAGAAADGRAADTLARKVLALIRPEGELVADLRSAHPDGHPAGLGPGPQARTDRAH